MTPQDKAGSKLRNIGQHADTIRRLRKESGLTPGQLADAIGVTINAIYNWESGKSRPDFSILPVLCDALNVSADEIIGRDSQKISLEEFELLRKYRRLSHYDQQSILSFMETLKHNRFKERQDNCRASYVPIYVAPYAMGAGLGEPLGDNNEQERIFVRITKESSRADRVVRVNGDSMMPTYQDGDLLLVEETENIKEGEIGIFVVAGEGFVKEFRHDGLHSHNSHYNTILPADDDNTRCIGRVLGSVTDAMLPDAEEQKILEEVFA